MTENPLLDEWTRRRDHLRDAHDFVEDPMWMTECMRCATFGEPEDDVRRRWSYAVPTPESLRMIADYAPAGIIEIGAGNGYWARLLAAEGTDVIAVDPNSVGSGTNDWYDEWDSETFYEVRQADHREVDHHGTRTLMISWPFMEDWAAECLRLFTGSRFVYIGEDSGGACATDAFFELLQQEWRLITETALPRWMGLHDYIGFYQRRHLSVDKRTGDVSP